MPKLIDLTHPLAHGQPNFPWDPKLSILSHNTVESIGYNIAQISMSTHQGTHMDAPFHFYSDGKTIDQIPLDVFYGPACLLRIPKEPGEEITVEDLRPFERKFTPGARIIYETGHQKRFGTGTFFSQMPLLTIEAARWIASKRIALLGMDTPTPGQDYVALHRTLMVPETEIILVEGLANLDQCPEGFTFVGFPLLLKGLDGSPIRAVAVIE